MNAPGCEQKYTNAQHTQYGIWNTLRKKKQQQKKIHNPAYSFDSIVENGKTMTLQKNPKLKPKPK